MSVSARMWPMSAFSPSMPCSVKRASSACPPYLAGPYKTTRGMWRLYPMAGRHFARKGAASLMHSSIVKDVNGRTHPSFANQSVRHARRAIGRVIHVAAVFPAISCEIFNSRLNSPFILPEGQRVAPRFTDVSLGSRILISTSSPSWFGRVMVPKACWSSSPPRRGSRRYSFDGMMAQRTVLSRLDNPPERCKR